MSGEVYRFGEFTLSVAARELRRGNETVALSPRGFDAIRTLIEHRDRAIGKDELITVIWGRPNVSDTQLGQAILLARRALGDDGQTQAFIRTVSRHGYRWVAAIECDPAPGTVIECDGRSEPSEPRPSPSTDDVAVPESGSGSHVARTRRIRFVSWTIALIVVAMGLAAWFRWNARIDAVMHAADVRFLLAAGCGQCRRRLSPRRRDFRRRFRGACTTRAQRKDCAHSYR